MFINGNIISCNSSTLPALSVHGPKLRTSLESQNLKPRVSCLKTISNSSPFFKPQNRRCSILAFQEKGRRQICHSIVTSQNSEDATEDKGDSLEGGLGGGGNGGQGRDWTTSILLLVLWGALMYYVFNLTPNQTPVLAF